MAIRSSPQVVLADQDRLVRDVVRLACDKRGIVVTAEVDSLDEAVSCCADAKAEVLVVADRFDDESVDGRLEEILATGVRIIILSADPSPERMTAALSLGASGYLFYDSAPEEIAGGILAVARGAAALNPTVAGIVLQQWRRLRARSNVSARRDSPSLTSRETDVLAAMADGLSAKAIAKELGVAVKTVENHKIRIFEKLGVRSQAHAVSVALRHGLLASRPVVVDGAAPED